jgi:nickel-dependent lactate racemase
MVGILHENALHANALEAARVKRVDFIVNTIPGLNGEIFAAVAGHMEKAWEQGIALCDQVCRLRVPKKADIVITCPGGFPRDLDLRQSQKAVSLAELVVQPNGVIILVAKCSDGIGEEDLYELLKGAGSPQQMIEKFRKLGFTASSRKAYMFARALLKARLIVVTEGVESGKLEEIMLSHAPTVEEALEMSFQQLGRDAKILGIPQADLLIPVVN